MKFQTRSHSHVGLLHDIARIDAAAKSSVQAKVDHLLQAKSVFQKQLAQSFFASVDQLLNFVVHRGLGSSCVGLFFEQSLSLQPRRSSSRPGCHGGVCFAQAVTVAAFRVHMQLSRDAFLFQLDK